MSERDEMQATLAWAGLPQVGEQTLLALLAHARESRQTLAQLWRCRIDDLAQLVPLHPRTVAALGEHSEASWAQAGADLDDSLLRGVELLTAFQPDFPPVLWQRSGPAPRRWPFLFAYGATGLLEEPRVAVVSSRDVTPVGLALTDALSDALARRDLPVVTSINREAYQASATAAKRHAGPAVMVMDRSFPAAFPHGLAREPVASARVWDEAFDPELQLLLSPFGWRDKWNARNGTRRDSLLLDLADVIVALDVRAGGHMERECRRAAERGQPVLAVDRGTETADGTRKLWETLPSARRTVWRGAEGVANEIVRLLPSRTQDAAGERLIRGWLRETSLFLCRMSSALLLTPPVIQAYPDHEVLAGVAQLWAGRAVQRSSGAEVMVADLWSTPNCAPAKVGQLLSRVAPGGLLAVLLPADWLTDRVLTASRAEWVQSAGLRVTVRLPLPALPRGVPELREAAVAVLQRQPPSGVTTQSFAPDQAQGGRFYLRRYLREVLAAMPGRDEAEYRRKT